MHELFGEGATATVRVGSGGKDAVDDKAIVTAVSAIGRDTSGLACTELHSIVGEDGGAVVGGVGATAIVSQRISSRFCRIKFWSSFMRWWVDIVACWSCERASWLAAYVVKSCCNDAVTWRS